MKNKNITEALDSFLCKVQKPARYTGGELNEIVKENTELRIALSYPDLYEVGMSNNGIKILYDIANSIDDAACERVFAVAPDFEEQLREREIPLYTLETFTPLSQLDMIGFNLSHELLYSNILQILDLGGVPLLREDRGDDAPIIIAGGEAVSNPFPVSDFIDIFFAGDGEEGFAEIIEVMLACRRQGINDRNEIIRACGKIPGVLVSSEYHFTSQDVNADSGTVPVVRKRILKGDSVYPSRPLVPSIRIAQERAVVEVARGCFNLCKFCHAGYYNLPYRACSYEEVSAEVMRQIHSTGYDEVTLGALSVSDYRHLVKLVNLLLPQLTEMGVSISLPSLKVDRNTLPLIEILSAVRKTSLTFAVESASGEIRSIANKKVKTEDLLEIVDFVFSRGWKVIKLYFMIGLPGCESSDEAEEIIALLKKILHISGRRKKDIHVTVSPFIPKPHTPFQWEKQMDMDYFYETVKRIKQGLPMSVKVKNHDVRSSYLEGLFARGDSSMGAVILDAYRKGARLDSWSEYFRFGIWTESFDRLLPERGAYLGERDRDVRWPWQVIETGSERAVEAMDGRRLDLENYSQPEQRYADEIDRQAFESAMARFEMKYDTVQVLRMEFYKTGMAKYIPHIDLMEVVKRSLRMAGMKLAFTQGFNKREKLSAGFPLPLGLESQSELFDVEFYEKMGETEMAQLPSALTGLLPEGIGLVSVKEREGKKSPMALTAMTRYEIVFHDEQLLKQISSAFEDRPELVKKGKTKETSVPFDRAVIDYSFNDNVLTADLPTGTDSAVRIDSLLDQITGRDSACTPEMKVMKKGQYELKDGSYTRL